MPGLASSHGVDSKIKGPSLHVMTGPSQEVSRTEGLSSAGLHKRGLWFWGYYERETSFLGSAKDMVYLARLGYRVVGVDGVRKAIEDFGKDTSWALRNSPWGLTSVGLMPPILE